jgi:transposase
MRQTHKAGEKCFIDYCGPTLPIVSPTTGEVRQAEVFVAVLGASNYTFAEATYSQSLQDWLHSHVRAFEFYGGVTELVIPDNLLCGAPHNGFYVE